MREAPGFSALPASSCLNVLLAQRGDPISSPTVTELPPHPKLPAQMPTTSQESPSPYHPQLAPQTQGD